MPCTAVPEQLRDKALIIIIVPCGPLAHQRACEQCIRTGVATGKLFDVGCGYNQVLRKNNVVYRCLDRESFAGFLLLYHLGCFLAYMFL